MLDRVTPLGTARHRHDTFNVPTSDAVQKFLHREGLLQDNRVDLHLQRAWLDESQGLRFWYQSGSDGTPSIVSFAGWSMQPGPGVAEADRLNIKHHSHAAAYSFELKALFTKFPVDRQLGTLPFASDAAGITPVIKGLSNSARHFGRWKKMTIVPVQYKPGRKCVLRYRAEWSDGDSVGTDPQAVFGRISHHAKHTFSILQALNTSQDNSLFQFPEPLRLIQEWDLELLSMVPGRPLSHLWHEVDFTEICGKVGTALALFHRSSIILDQQAGHLPGPMDLANIKARIARACPDLIATLRPITKSLEKNFANMRSRMALVHGDFHPGNILIDGDQLGLLDFEECGMGDPAADVGFFSAELILLALKQSSEPMVLDAALQAFWKGYLAASPGMHGDDLPVWTALCCLWCADHQCIRRPGQDDSYTRTHAMVQAADQFAHKGHARDV